MKFVGAAVLAVSCMPYSDAFVGPQFAIRPVQASKLNLHGNSDGDSPGWVGPAATVVAGLTVASQMVGATVGVSTPAPMEIIQAAPQMQQVQSTSTSVFSGSSLYLSDSEYLDFSMPSYGNSAGESIPKEKLGEVPSFSNPFSSKSDDSPSAANKQAEEDTKAADKAAAEARKEEEKASAAERKIQERADREAAAASKKAEKEAAEAKKEAAAEEAAAKKVEKEIRRQAQLEKQKAAVERAKEAESASAPAPAPAPAPAAPAFKAPAAPDIKPDIKVPEFKAPDVKIPDFKIPEFSAPSFSMPKIDMPVMPKVDMPKSDMPKADAPKAPSFDMPKAPSFDMPKAPSFSTPQSSYDLSSSPASAGEDIEPQEARDEQAKAARSVYKEADETAKEAERKADVLRSVANGKKKVAKEAKDEACQTRFGGKILCVRPLNSGY